MTLTTLAFLIIAITLPVSYVAVKSISYYYAVKANPEARQAMKKVNA